MLQLFEDHGAIYLGFDGSVATDQSAHKLIEMQGKGAGSAGSTSCKTPGAENVAINNLQVFRGDGEYHGAYDFGAPRNHNRLAFIEKARSLVGKVPYVEDPSVQFINWVDENLDGVLQEREIRNLRSDAFVEYVYTSADKGKFSMGARFWFLHGGGSLASNMIDATDLYNRTHIRLGFLVTVYTPRGQRTQMIASDPHDPTLEIKDLGGQLVPDNGLTNQDTLTAKMIDDESGPGRLEIWRGDPDAGGGAGGAAGVNRVFLDDTDYDSAEHVYSLPPLTESGLYVAKALDRAGNETVARFRVNRPPKVSISDASTARTPSSSLFNDFRGDSTRGPSPSTIFPRYFSGIGLRADDPDHIVSVSLSSGPGFGQTWQFSNSTSVALSYEGAAPGDPRLQAGTYTFTLRDGLGATTAAQFYIRDLEGVLVSSSGFCNPETREYSWSLRVFGKGTAPIDHIERIEGLENVAQMGFQFQNLDFSRSGASEQPPGAICDSAQFKIVDREGNSVLYDVSLIAGTDGEGNPKTFVTGFTSPLRGTTLYRSPLPQRTPLGMGLSTLGLNVAEPGFIDVRVGNGRPEVGYQLTPGIGFSFDLALGATKSGASTVIAVPFTLVVDFNPVGLTEAQKDLMNLVSLDGQRFRTEMAGAKITSSQVQITVTEDQLGSFPFRVGNFVLEAPLAKNPRKKTFGSIELLFDADDGDLNLISVNPNVEPYRTRLEEARARGLVPEGQLYLLTPENRTLATPAVLKARGVGQITEIEGFYQLSPAGQERLSQAQGAYVDGSIVTAEISQISSLIGVFRAIDALAPVTQILVNPPSQQQDQNGNAIIFPDTQISFSATDPNQPGFPVSGVNATLVEIDGNPAIANPGQLTLPLGQHTLRYYSVDGAGNHEAPKTARFTVQEQGGGGGGIPGVGQGNGWAVAVDGDFLWAVVSKDDQYKLARYDKSLNLLSETLLEESTEPGSWTVRPDGQGNAVAVGNAGRDLAIYKVSSAGALEKVVRLDPGQSRQAFVFDATGDVIIAGGTTDLSDGTSELALWKYCFHSDNIQLLSTYSRGAGFDAGYGVRVMDGSIWVAGLSRNPAPKPGKHPIDLGLWHFDSSGRNLVAGPFFREGYLQSTQGEVLARLEAHAGSLYLTATRTGDGSSDLGFVRMSTSGSPLIERVWSSANSRNDIPKAMAVSNGEIVVGGRTQSGQSFTALWRYSAQGDFLGASTIEGSSGIEGLAVEPGAVWLAFNNTPIPFRLSSTSPVEGSDVLVPLDSSPPATSLVLGDPKMTLLGLPVISPQTDISFSVQDDESGVARIEYKVDGGALQIFENSFTLAQGTHLIEYRAVDNAGNEEVFKSTQIAVATFQLGAVAGVQGVTISGSASILGLVQSNSRVVINGKPSVGEIVDAPGTLHPDPIDVPANQNGPVELSGTMNDVVIVSRSTHPITITGNAKISGIVYAPNAELTILGNAQAQGRYFAKTIKIAGNPVVGGGAPSGSLGTAEIKPAETADPAFTLRAAYAYPNPARNRNPTIRVQCGLADSVEIKIFDSAGHLLHTGQARTAQVVDDGNGLGPQYSYDYPWNAAGHGTGVYLFVATAKKAGATPIRTSGKAGVIK